MQFYPEIDPARESGALAKIHEQGEIEDDGGCEDAVAGNRS
jgi:hypothetical protein